MIYDLEKFGNIISKLREEKKLNYVDVQRQSGLDRNKLMKLEYGEVEPTLKNLKQMSQCFEVDTITIYASCAITNDDDIVRLYIMLEDEAEDKGNYSLSDISKELMKIEHDMSPNKCALMKNVFNTFRVWIEISTLIDSNNENDLRKVEYLIIDHFRKIHPHFTIKRFKSYHYDLFELRILLLLAFSFMSTEQSSQGLELCDFILDKLKYESESNLIANNIKSRTYYIKSYSHFLLSEDMKSIETANQGIELARNSGYIKILPDLYIRRAIGKLLCNKNDYKNDFMLACMTCEALGDFNTLESIKKSISEHYNINLDDYYISAL